MEREVNRYQGCLLGLAVGDAMGYTIDEKSWREIQTAYGPNGLLGYDIANGVVELSSYTQLAAYTANGLLVALTRGRREYYLRYITLALKDWLRSQQFYRDPEKPLCWVSRLPEFRRRHCRDSRMLDTLRTEALGTPSRPRNQNAAPGALTTAVALGLSFQPERMDPAFLGVLAAQTMALTHGNPETILSSVVLSYTIAGILQEPELPLQQQFSQSIAAMEGQFSREFPQAAGLSDMLLQVVEGDKTGSREAMESLHCQTADQCLAGAMYASLACRGDFDTGMILSVNHSGRSSAVGAVTGAILGAQLGAEALPEFYLEGLEGVQPLRELAEDLAKGSPAFGFFDDDWDHKYTQGLPSGG